MGELVYNSPSFISDKGGKMNTKIMRGFAVLGMLGSAGCVVTPVRTTSRPVVYAQPTAVVVQEPAVVETVVVTPIPIVPVIPPPPKHHPAWHYPPVHPRLPHPVKPMPAPPPPRAPHPIKPMPAPHGRPHHPSVHRGR